MVSRTVVITLLSVLGCWITLATLLDVWGTGTQDKVIQFAILVALAITGGTLFLDHRFSSS